MAAAQAANGKVIGVDVDQSGESETVITSATKGLAAAVVKALGEYYEGKFPGGQAVVMDAKLDGVGLPMATSRFTTFTQADYDAVFKKLVDGEVKLQKDSDVASVNEITVENVKVTEFK
jgi:basic membrane protein A